MGKKPYMMIRTLLPYLPPSSRIKQVLKDEHAAGATATRDTKLQASGTVHNLPKDSTYHPYLMPIPRDS